MRAMRHVLAAGLVAGLGLLCGCGGGSSEQLPEPIPVTPNPHPAGTSFTIPSPLGGEPVKVEVLAAGAGPAVQRGSLVQVHYVAKAVGQQPYDDTRKKGPPKEAVAGMGSVLPGFDLALQRMREGDTWRITFPPELGFGEHAGPRVPKGSTIQVEATLVKIER